MRVAIYARYSSDNQKEASIEDQLRICKEHAAKERWDICGTYTDAAISGSSLIRPGIQKLMTDANAGRFDVVLAEALDRLSRDQEDIAGFYKRMQFAGIRIVTLSEGEISNLHIGLKGTMNAMFLKDLADKTRRGQRGRVEAGKSGGGKTYGYDNVRRIGPDGEYARGERAINESEAVVIRRIFAEMIQGHSARSVAKRLNDDGIPGPQGAAWGFSTIYGNRQRGTGILNNELYIGRVIWNRLRYVKDPDTGKRISRLNPEDQWVRVDAPELRIIDQDMWDAYRKVQGDIVPHSQLFRYNRPKNLLSGLMKCGCCGGGVIIVGANQLGCANRRNKGTCDNHLTIKRETVEERVLGALQEHLMDDDLCQVFCKEFTRRMNELRAQHNASLDGYRAEYRQMEREREKIIKAITDGVDATLFITKSKTVQRRIEELEVILSAAKEEPLRFHPNMGTRYKEAIKNLIASLSDDSARIQASAILRSLIDYVLFTPHPTEGRLVIDLVGDLAGILAIASNGDKKAVSAELSELQPVQSDDNVENLRQIVTGRMGTPHKDTGAPEGTPAETGSLNAILPDALALVAGAGFEPATFRL